jgi:hypothetical protein
MKGQDKEAKLLEHEKRVNKKRGKIILHDKQHKTVLFFSCRLQLQRSRTWRYEEDMKAAQTVKIWSRDFQIKTTFIIF